MILLQTELMMVDLFRILALIGEYRRKFTAMKVIRNFKAQDVV
jgi:hypothetical protein